jgi:hypothetical protein
MRRTVGKKGLGQISEFAKMAVSGVAAAVAGSHAMAWSSRWVSWETFPGAVLRFVSGGAVIAAIFFSCALLLRSGTARSIRKRRDLFRPPDRPVAETPPVPPGSSDL